MKSTQRRVFLKGTMTGGAALVAATAGLLNPGRVLAAWPEKAFNAEKTGTALEQLYGDAELTESDDIRIQAPDIAENGSVVPVTVNTGIADAERITLMVAANGTPLAASFVLADNTDGYVSTRLKMAGTSDVVATVEAGGAVYVARKQVKVTIGGCGG